MISNQAGAYKKLEHRFRQYHRLNDLRSIVSWDEAVMMPAGSGEARGDALGELGVVLQNLIADPQVGDWLREAEALTPSLAVWEAANLQEMRRVYIENTSIPADLNQRLTTARIRAEQAWRRMRAENDWKGFLPYMQETLDLTREALHALSAELGQPLYDTALGLYSKGLTAKAVETLFGELRGFLPGMIQEVVEKQKSEKVIVPAGRFPMAAQKALCFELMKLLGFNTEQGRLDESHHPFCGGTPRDVRITTRYTESEFVSSLMGVLHETGHALYEQNLPREWVEQPVGQACGMAMHESQSLLVEMQMVRSPEYIEFAAPLIRQYLEPYTSNPESLQTENLIRLVSRVRPGLIRVDADEVTYPMHVLLRFEIERDLLSDAWPLADLPGVWNDKMQKYLGLSTLGNDKDGCMQDTHWPGGAWGYFPSYTFGAVIAAQLFASLEQARPLVRQEIRRGEFGGMQSWLRDKIWSQGSRWYSLELIEKVAGPLTSQPFRKHLGTRYLERSTRWSTWAQCPRYARWISWLLSRSWPSPVSRTLPVSRT